MNDLVRNVHDQIQGVIHGTTSALERVSRLLGKNIWGPVAVFLTGISIWLAYTVSFVERTEDQYYRTSLAFWITTMETNKKRPSVTIDGRGDHLLAGARRARPLDRGADPRRHGPDRESPDESEPHRQGIRRSGCRAA